MKILQRSLFVLLVLFTAGAMQDLFSAIPPDGFVEISHSSHSYFIDQAVEDKTSLSRAVSISQKNDIFHMFTHGRSGELFIEDTWLDCEGITAWVQKNNLLQNHAHLNIYGCEFAKGETGRKAVLFLEKNLGVSVAASDDITGKNGDWELEAGNPQAISLPVKEYRHNLQVVASDDFTSGNFSGGTGWATGSWTTAGSPTVVSGEVFSDGGVDRSITRTVDLSAYTIATWTMDWECDDSSFGFDSGDDVFFQVSYNGGSSYDTLQTLIAPCGSGGNNTGSVSLRLTGGNSDTRIRVLTSTNSASEDMYFDNVVIDGTDPCDASASGDPDADGDNISDICDVDDDNDGILDTDEMLCGVADWTTNGYTAGSTDYQPGISGVGTVGAVSVDFFGVEVGTPSYEYLNIDNAIGGNGTEGLEFRGNETTSAIDAMDWTLDFSQTVYNVELYFGGVDNDDEVVVTAFHQGNAVTIGSSNFSNYPNIIYSAPNTVFSSNDPAADHNSFAEAFYFTLAGPVDSIIFNAFKGNGDVGNATFFISDFAYCVPLDTDGDNLSNHLDLDADADGCSDAFESGATTNTTINYKFTDLSGDADGLSPSVDAGGDGTPDYTATLSQVTDAVAACDCPYSSGIDTDGDGTDNTCDLDDDNDGIVDSVEYHCAPMSINTVSSAVGNTQNFANFDATFTTLSGTDPTLYSAGGFDGLELNLSEIEIAFSVDMEEISFSLADVDALEKTRIRIYDENNTLVSSISPYIVHAGTRFTYSDIPGHSLLVEGLVNFDLPSYDPLTRIDFTLNFLVSRIVIDFYNVATGTPELYITNACPVIDTDSDGISDHLDLDSDNDGIPDLIEAGGIDTDGNGLVDDATDTDNDGLADSFETTDGSTSNLLDTNGDGTNDNDGDFDGDGKANWIDLDADGDGILDIIEAGGTDANRDGIGDNATDADDDGYFDIYDPNASDGPGGTGTNGTAHMTVAADGGDTDTRLEYIASGGIGDSDGDDVPDFLDVDSDNDGIYDIYESQATSGFTPRTGVDTDGDGIDNAFDDDDVNWGGAGAAGTTPVNTDSGTGDTTPDYLDTDADGDGFPDLREAWDALEDGDNLPDGVTGSCTTDSDGDGLVDCFDNDDADKSDWTINVTPPNDDGTGGVIASLGINIAVATDVDDIFPTNKIGSNPGEPDWRDISITEYNGVLGGYIWSDEDKDGIQDVAETGLSGQTVSLLNNSSNVVATTETDAQGEYQFEGLPAGDYSIKVTPPSNYGFTTPNVGGDDNIDSELNATTGISTAFTLAAGDTNLLADGGLIFISKATAILGDYVWLDTDSDNTQGGSDLGFAGITVTLYDNSGDPVATTITDQAGKYRFTEIVPGTYTLGVTLPMGYGLVTQVTGTATGSDMDPATRQSPSVILSAGEENNDIDIGLKALASNTANVGGRAWNDLNEDGIQNAGEPDFAGVKVVLYDRDGTTKLDSTVSDEFGNYVFTGLTPGKYHIATTPPSGYIYSPPFQGGDDTQDSDINPSGLSYLFVVYPGERNTDLDVALYDPTPAGTARIGDFMWYDYDKDGIQDAGEPGAPGVTVTLYNSSDTKIATTTTDKNGAFSFTSLSAQSYYFVVKNTPEGYDYSPVSQGGNTALDSDIEAGGRSSTIALSAGQNDPDQDVGLLPQTNPAGTAAVGGRSWNDVDGDGIQDAGELGLAGIEVILYAADGTTVLETTETNALGEYMFPGLETGSYQVEFVSASYPANYAITSQNQGTDDQMDSDIDPGNGKTSFITVSPGQKDLAVDAGFNNPTAGISSAGGNVWNDLDGDGILDSGENAMAGVSVVLYDNLGDTLAVTTTDKNGEYRFYDLPAGDFQVGFANLPDGYNFSPEGVGADDAVDSDADDITGKTPTFTLASATDLNDIDVGIFSTSSGVSGYVWSDEDSDGLQDANESGLGGILVTLYDNSNNPVATAVTDGNGVYTFSNTAPGTYTIGHSNTPTGSAYSPQDNTGDDTNDSDGSVSTGRTASFVLAASSATTTIGQGIQPNLKTGLGNYVWFDANTDGVQDGFEPGIAGVTVTLFDNVGAAQSAMVTDGSGFYQFENLNPGTYYIGLSTTPPNATITTKDAGAATESTDSDLSIGTGLSDPIAIATGTYNADLDAGLILQGVLGGLVWYDNIRDGILGYTESLATGVTIELLAADSSTVIATTTNNTYFGSFFFTNLPAGDYHMRFKNLPATYGLTIPNAGVNDRIDSDPIPAPSLTEGTTYKVTIGAGGKNMFTYAGLNSTPFAVEWLEFTAFQMGPDALVTWATAQEKNADYYEVQRSIDGNLFTKIGIESAVGDTDQISEYQFTDPNIASLSTDRVYYRLRQIDQDGKFDLSNIIELDLTSMNFQIFVSIAPNPVRDFFHINYTRPDGMNLEVVNTLGQQVYTQELRDVSGKLKIGVQQWPEGFYYVRFVGNTKQEVFKIQVVR